MRSNFTLNIILLLTFLGSTLCCLVAQELIDPAVLPPVEDYVEVRSNPNADTVLLMLQGGPVSFLLPVDYPFLEAVPTFSVVEVKKHEMLVPVLQLDTLTLEEGIAVNDTTAALIEKAVQYYRSEGKYVALLGQSWGAIVIGEYLDDYGLDNVDKLVAMEGRLNIQQEFVDYLLAGYLPNFNLGDSIVLLTEINFFPATLLNLSAAALANRWVDSLAGLNLEKMLYTYAEYDFQTGALLPEEIEFIESGGGQVLFIPMGMHGDSFMEEYQSQIIAFIRGDQPVSNGNFITVDSALKLYPTVANDWVLLEADAAGTALVFDAVGRLVYEAKHGGTLTRIDITSFSSGHYYVVLQAASAAQVGQFLVR
ncbi:MAG: T9SS type A sorting domain-containing protein [Bacteroidota bacterium]